MHKATITRIAELQRGDPPERLVELIQNRSGKTPVVESEAAMTVLVKQFQGLIQSIVKRFYFGINYQLHNHGYDKEDFAQEVILEFLNLTYHDFQFKDDDPDDDVPVRAVFGNYMKVKLNFRILAWVQKNFPDSPWNRGIPVDFEAIEQRGLGPAGNFLREDPFTSEVRQAILANVLEYDELVLDSITRQVQIETINDLIDISNTRLDKRDRKVWYLYYFTGYKVEEIAEMIPAKSTKGRKKATITRRRVTQIAVASNEIILAEYGRRTGMRRTAIGR